MLTSPFPIYRSVLHPDALIAQVLAQYALGDDPLTCHLYSRGINDVYQVAAGPHRWMLRVTAANGQTPAAVHSEIDLLRYLDAANIPVAVPVPRRDGDYLTFLAAPEGTRTAVLFEYVDQFHTRTPTPEQARQYGAALARMHLAADTYPAALQRPFHNQHSFIDEPLAHLESFSWFAGRTAELAYLRATAPQLWEQAQRLPKTAPQYGFCHCDAMSGNAFYGDDGTVTLIDFDYGGIGWRVYDLATYLWVLIVDGPELNWSQQPVFRALLAGYQSVRPLTAVEFEALPVFAALRQLFLFGAAIKYSPGFGVQW
ncbi:MAG: phosphotransferase, partial [Anaerolineae bacterium]|nr:phosphotransferase [Anaerolineae bacterium]